MAKQATVNVGTATNGGCDGMWTLISVLLTCGWTKVSDSDGTTYSAGGTQVTGPGAGANGLNNARAWVRMRDPGGLREFIFQRATSTQDYNWRCKYSAVARFTGGSPAATVVPSATDEVILSGGGTDASPTFTALFTSTPGAYRVHAIAQDAAVGDVYAFWLLATPNAGGDPTGGCFCEALAVGSYPAGDTDPAIQGGYLSSSPYGNTAGANRGWYKHNLSGAAFVDFGSVCLQQVVSAVGSGQLSGDATTTLAGVNPIDGRDNTIPAMWARVGSTSSAGWKGSAAHMKTKMVNKTYPDTLDLATDAYVYAEGYLVPWPNGVTPL